MYTPVVPLFGTLLVGMPALGVQVVLGVLYLWLAFEMFRLKKRSVDLSVALLLVWCLSSFITFQKVGAIELYRAMGLTETQIEMTARSPFGSMSMSNYVFLCIPWILYLLWIKRFFKAPPAGSPG